MLDYLYAPVLQALTEGHLDLEFDSKEITRRAWTAWGYCLGSGRWEFARVADLLLLLASEVRFSDMEAEADDGQLELF